MECIEAGARLVNLSAALAQVPSAKGEHALGQALDHAANRGVIVVAAAGNRGRLEARPSRDPWVIAVIACDRRGRPLSESNLGNSIGRRGLSAPGEGITSLVTDGSAGSSGRHQCCGSFCDRGNRIGVVGVSLCRRRPGEIGCDSSSCAALAHDCPAFAKRVGDSCGHSGISFDVINEMKEKQASKETAMPALPDAPARFRHREGNWPGRCHQTRDFSGWDQDLRRMRTPCRGAQSLVCFQAIRSNE